MKKKVIAIIVIFVILIGGGYFAYTKIIVPEEKIVVDMDKEYREYMQLVYGEEYEMTFADQIKAYVIINYPFLMTRFSDELECEVTYPDLKSYFLENQTNLLEMNEEELKSNLLQACEKVEKKSVTITFPAEYDDGFLLLDSDCFEYQNALSGGLQELAAERFSELLDEMYVEVEE